MPVISPERITTLTGTTFELVVQPTEFKLTRDPETNQVLINFYWTENITVDGAVKKKHYARYGNNARRLSDVGSVNPAYPGEVDPNTGADLTNISMDGVIALLLSAFDKVFVQDSQE